MIVTHVISGLDPRDGGPPVALEGLVLAQRALDTEVRVVSTYRDGDSFARSERLRDAGVAMTLIGPTKTPLQLKPGMTAAVRGAIAGSDVLHVHNLWEQMQHVTASLARRAGIPYLLRPCGMLDPWSLSQSAGRKRWMLRLRTRRDLNDAAAVHYTSDAERDGAKGLGLTSRPLVVPNGLDTEPFERPVAAETALLDERVPEFAGRPKVVFLSRLHPKKGGDILIEAFVTLLAKWPAEADKPALVFVGPDEAETQPKWEGLVRQRGLEQDVRFVGLLNGDDKVAALREADVFCLPSHQENFGIAVVEALAAGTAVVISDQVNIHGAITEAGLGSAVPLDANALSDALRHWLDDFPGRQRVAERALAWVRDTYGWDGIARQWCERLYPELIENAKVRRQVSG
ncbi:MAG: glycosyltransferase [Planctomycetota bacterium]